MYSLIPYGKDSLNNPLLFYLYFARYNKLFIDFLHPLNLHPPPIIKNNKTVIDLTALNVCIGEDRQRTILLA